MKESSVGRTQESWLSSMFQFRLRSVEEITPWGEPGKQSLSWFALTDGDFRVSVGDDALFRYSGELRASGGTEYAEYQIAAFTRDILCCASAALSPLPELFESLVRDPNQFWQLKATLTSEDESDDSYAAWRWLGERSPWMSYLVSNPRFAFVRVGAEVWTLWNNTGLLIDGVQAWQALRGVHRVSAGMFENRCRELATHLLGSMEKRIGEIEAGSSVPQVGVDVASLREQHETWTDEFNSYFQPYSPDIRWDEAAAALRRIADSKDLMLPE